MPSSAAGSLIGRRLLLTVSDPWDCVDDTGSNMFEGTVCSVDAFSKAVEAESILLRLTKPMTLGTESRTLLALSPRYGQGLVDSLCLRKETEVNFIGVREDGRTKRGMMEWRGGVAGVGTVAPALWANSTQG